MDQFPKSSTDSEMSSIARNVLRSYLVRCYSHVSKVYPAIASMPPEQGADHLLALRDAKKVEIVLNVKNELIKCQITDVQ